MSESDAILIPDLEFGKEHFSFSCGRIMRLFSSIQVSLSRLFSQFFAPRKPAQIIEIIEYYRKT
jgi:hypothetical protein